MCITEIKMPRNEDELLKPSTTRAQIVNHMHINITGWELNSQQATSYNREPPWSIDELLNITQTNTTN